MKYAAARKPVPRCKPEDHEDVVMKEIHCAHPECGKFLGYEALHIGMIHIKCRKCKNITLVSTFPEDTPAPKAMREVRCANCGRFLYYEAIISGIAKVKCRGCGEWNVLEINPESALDITPKVPIMNL